MLSTGKNHWWQKKTAWGLVIVAVTSGLMQVPAFTPIHGLLKTAQDWGLVLAGYGAVEVVRSIGKNPLAPIGPKG